jgi:RimJ/RimL family protein N-acetyltransferase
MESMANMASNAFRSERLVYRSMEETDADRDWTWKNLWSDPANMGLAGPATLTPPSREKLKQNYEEILKGSHIAVFICLPPEAPATGATDDGQDAKSDAKPQGEEAGEPTPIGIFRLSKNVPDCFKMQSNMGITIAAPYQNKGYGREAINWGLDWAFQHGNLRRVELNVVAYNERAIALYKSVGFTLEGRARESVFRNRRYWDYLSMGILVHEWEQLRGLQ